MVNSSPFLLTKQLEANILRLLAHIDIVDLNTKEQHILAQLKNSLIDARLEIQDYELAETRELQLGNAKQAKEYLDAVQKTISNNSLNVFGPVDVAHLTAYIGQITDRLK
jgi:hypothetical protein